MDFKMFSLMTVLGSALWCSVLAWFGQKIGHENPGALKDPEALMRAFKDQSPSILIAIVALIVLYVVVMRLTGPKQNADSI
jgi:membrane protein DedA with SNARE-associated domain